MSNAARPNRPDPFWALLWRSLQPPLKVPGPSSRVDSAEHSRLALFLHPKSAVHKNGLQEQFCFCTQVQHT